MSKEPSDKSGGEKILTDKDKEDINKGMWQFNTLVIILFSKFLFLIAFSFSLCFRTKRKE